MANITPPVVMSTLHPEENDSILFMFSMNGVTALMMVFAFFMPLTYIAIASTLAPNYLQRVVESFRSGTNFLRIMGVLHELLFTLPALLMAGSNWPFRNNFNYNYIFFALLHVYRVSGTYLTLEINANRYYYNPHLPVENMAYVCPTWKTIQTHVVTILFSAWIILTLGFFPFVGVVFYSDCILIKFCCILFGLPTEFISQLNQDMLKLYRDAYELYSYVIVIPLVGAHSFSYVTAEFQMRLIEECQLRQRVMREQAVPGGWRIRG